MTYDFCKLLGDRIQEIIEEKKEEIGFNSIYDLSLKSGVPQSTLYRIIRGECYDPSFRQMARLAKYLEISLDTFMASEELKNYDFNADDPNRPVRNIADQEEDSEE